MYGRSVISNCYSDGGNITTPSAATSREELLPAAASDPLGFGRVCSDPRDTVVAEWLLSDGIQRVVVVSCTHAHTRNREHVHASQCLVLAPLSVPNNTPVTLFWIWFHVQITGAQAIWGLPCGVLIKLHWR